MNHTPEQWENVKSNLNIKFEDGRVVVKNTATDEGIYESFPLSGYIRTSSLIAFV